ncbi:MAG: hotdog fold thioesterase [Bacteroidetes bacterium]|nr:hotdog fold thioesterase [Bacteroidota bacterium]
MSLFFKPEEISIDQLNKRCENTLSHWIGIEFTEMGEDYLMAKMPVDHRTVQPLGVVNGGAYCTLAETLGSMAANLCIDRSKYVALGLDINANHVRSAGKGWVTAIAKPFHLGKTTQVWEIKMMDDDGKLCSISRLTMAVIAIDKN